MAPAAYSSTSLAPALVLQPVHYSLTEGTSIPPPAPESDEPQSHSPKQLLRSKHSGPLSSHPVTPIGPDQDAPSFFHNSTQFAANAPSTSSVPFQTREHVSRLSASDGSALSYDQVPQRELPKMMDTLPEDDGNRRPSFARRFMRLRSLSSLRSLGGNGSSASLAQSRYLHREGVVTPDMSSVTESRDSQSRGTKRPMSPSGTSGTRSHGQVSQDGRQSHSFPRMVRKKSMELLGSARRKSGMWGGGSMDSRGSLMAQEAERERMREEEERLETARSPAPRLPELGNRLDGGRLGTDDMFMDIGR